MRGLSQYSKEHAVDFHVINHRVLCNHHVAWVKVKPKGSGKEHFKVVCECDLKGQFLNHGIWIHTGKPRLCPWRKQFLELGTLKFKQEIYQQKDQGNFFSLSVESQQEIILALLRAILDNQWIGQEFQGSIQKQALYLLFDCKTAQRKNSLDYLLQTMYKDNKIGFDSEFLFQYYMDPNQ